MRICIIQSSPIYIYTEKKSKKLKQEQKRQLIKNYITIGSPMKMKDKI